MITAIWFDVLLVMALLLSAGMVIVMLRQQDLRTGGLQPLLERGAEQTLMQQGFYPSRLMRQAGIMPRDLLFIYWPGRIVLALLLPLALLEHIGPGLSWWLLLLAGVLGFFAQDIWLMRRRQHRRLRINQSLGFFVDLLRAYLSSGSPLSQAFEYAARFGFKPQHPLAKEALLVCAELDAGQSLRAALQAMSDRTGVEGLRRLAGVLDVGTYVGAPILDTLAKQADILRVNQRVQITQILNRKSMEMLLPMGLVGVPMFLLLVMFPAGVQLFEAFQLLKQLI